MSLKDMWATDENGQQFVFTVEMQRRLIDEGMEPTPEAWGELGETAVSPKPAKSEPSNNQSHHSPKSDKIDFSIPMTIQIDPATGKYVGRMKWYNAKKGYGFIVRGGGEEIFFHKSAMAVEPDNFSEGQWILYDIEETQKGPEAADIEPYTGDVEQLS